MPIIPIPIRFENILVSEELEFAPLLVAVEEDLRFFDRLRRRAAVQGSGAVAFPAGLPGSGKTTALYAAAALAPDLYEPVFTVPSTIPEREIGTWLGANLPAPRQRCTIVRLDGREASDDTAGLRQLMSGLNQSLRGRSDIIVCWPTVDPDWRTELFDLGRKVGGAGFCPDGFDGIVGPPREVWPEVLNRILIQLDHTLNDVALDTAFIHGLAASDKNVNVGGFLEEVATAIAERVDEVQLSQRLPQLVFVVTSSSEIVGEANRLRQAGTYLLKGQELLSYSPRSEVGKWWGARSGTPEHQLGYVIALFRARLATMTPSSIGYASLLYGDEGLRMLATTAGMTPSASNATTTFKNTDFYRLLIGQPSTELTSSNKGKNAPTTLAAHTAIQAASSKRHKAINQAICQLAETVVPSFAAREGTFELDQGDQNSYTDAVIPLAGEDLYLEFHHLSAAHCRAASVSAYVMEKLRTYAWHHNIIPR